MKNYLLIALALLLGTVLSACVGCAPPGPAKPSYLVKIMNDQGEVVRTYKASLLWSISGNCCTFTDASNGRLTYAVNPRVIIEPITGTEDQ